ncbi:MAG: hypothetical protein VX320_05195 [Candidatus Thermoplasmatota archaeon]|nr:hypothetical protein [Candidatus Thermoplasmatota archaeon]
MNWNRWMILAIILFATAGISFWLWNEGYPYAFLCCLFLPFEGLFFNMKKDSESTSIYHDDAQGL